MIVTKDTRRCSSCDSDKCVIESYSSSAEVPLLVDQREESTTCSLVSKSPPSEIENRAVARSKPTSPVND